MKNILCYIGKKLLMAVPILIGVTLLAFILGVISPSDPAEVVLGMDGIASPTEEEITIKRHELGLDRSYVVQYVSWVEQILKGDLGTSYITKTPIAEEIARRLPVTISVSVCALFLVVFIGIPLGIFMALHQEQRSDHVLRIGALLITSIPGFWLAIILMRIFCEQLHLLPTSGYGTWQQLVMPSFVLAAGTIGVIMRLNRSTLLEVLEENFILTERSKGLPFPKIIWRHGFPNSLIPIVTLLGNYFGGILGGSTIIEVIFALPGMGSYVIEGIMSRDYPVVQGYVIFTGVIFIIFNLLIDLVYVVLNPKIRLEGR
ncbi:MAG: ABC transporter permease [Clostridiales bacterium]